MRALLEQASKAVFDVDRGLWYTLQGLLKRPGEIINGYLDGQRVRNTSPFTLLLLFTGINAVLYTSGLLDLSQLTGSDSAEAQQLASEGTRWMFQYYSVVLLLLLPVASAITRWCFAACDRNYAEHLIINTYITAITVMFTAVLFPILLALRPEWLSIVWNSVLPLTGVYNVFALVKVFGPTAERVKVMPRAIAAVALYYLRRILAQRPSQPWARLVDRILGIDRPLEDARVERAQLRCVGAGDVEEHDGGGAVRHALGRFASGGSFGDCEQRNDVKQGSMDHAVTPGCEAGRILAFDPLRLLMILAVLNRPWHNENPHRRCSASAK
jgi:hypothetical protein